MTTIEPITQEIILSRLCNYFKAMPETFLIKKNGREEILFIRQVYTYCLWLYTGLKRSQIGTLINRNGSVVSTTIQVIRKRCSVDEDYRNRIIEIENLFE